MSSKPSHLTARVTGRFWDVIQDMFYLTYQPQVVTSGNHRRVFFLKNYPFYRKAENGNVCCGG